MLDELDGPALRAWQVFKEQMQQRYGRPPGRGNYFNDRWRNVYRKVAELCERNGVFVDDFIVQGFELLNQSRGQYITIKDFIYQNKVMTAYLDRRKQFGDGGMKSWITQYQMMTDMVCRTIPDQYESEEAILVDLDTPISMWFRPLYPEVFSDMVFKIYGESAWKHLRINRHLRDVAREQSPRNFKELARRWGDLR